MLQINIQPGTYVVAVSGGVDSMALLDCLRRAAGVEIIVAHVNHGIRTDAIQDEQLVRHAAMSHNLRFVSTRLALGPGASEELSRTERYKFLRHIAQKYAVDAIITAHHRDDVIETAIINVLRGTGWRGLSSLRSRNGLLRPLLHVPKAEIVAYAKQHAIAWREDTTNSDQSYLRNHVRHEIIPQMTPMQINTLYQNIVRQNKVTSAIEHEIQLWMSNHVVLHSPGAILPRYDFVMVPSNVAHELLQEVLRRVGSGSLPRPLVDRALLFVKVAKAHKTFILSAQWQLRILPHQVIVEQRPTVVS